MSMPEAAVNQDRDAVPGENDVGATGEVTAMKTEPVPEPVEH